MPTAYESLLADSEALRVLLYEITVWTGTEEVVHYFCDSAWDEGWVTGPDEDPANEMFWPRVANEGWVETTEIPFDEIIAGVAAPTYSEIELINRDGGLDSWRTYSVDARRIRVFMVGTLRGGTKIRFSDVEAAPLFDGLGDGFPEVGEEFVRISVRNGLHKLDKPAQPTSYSPACLAFPGTAAGCVDFGDRYDSTGSFTFEAWIYLTSTTAGYIVQKDTGTAGWGFQIGAAGAGSLRAYVREQTPVTTDTATGLLRLLTWHHVAMRVDTAAQTRTIYLDRTQVANSTGVTGSPAGNAASFKLGVSMSGEMSECRKWSTARTLAQIESNMYLTLLGSETGLEAYPALSDGRGGTTADRRSGVSITGTLGTGVTWAVGEWATGSVAGRQKYRPLGYCLDVEAVPVDPAKNIFQVSGATVVSVPAVRSNHNALTVGTYSVDKSRALVTLNSAAGGTITADVVGETRWGAATDHDGVDDRNTFGDTADQTSSFTLLALIRPRNLETQAFGRIISKDDGATGWVFALSSAGSKALLFLIRGGSAVASSACLTDGVMVHVAAVFDAAAQQMRIYCQGELVGSTAATVSPVGTAHTLSVGARHDGASPFAGAIDMPVIVPRAMTQAEIRYRVVHPWTTSDIDAETGAEGWAFDEGSGTSLASLRTGGPSGTITGSTWTYSRVAHADLVLSLLYSAGYSRTDIDHVTFAEHLAAVPGDAGWLVGDGSSHSEVLSRLLVGCGSVLDRESETGLIRLYQWTAPDGDAEEAHQFSEEFDCRDEPIEPDPQVPLPAWRVVVGYARNNTPMGAESVAGIVTSQPDRYQFATQEWRRATKQDSTVLDAYPTARTVGGREDGEPDGLPSAFLNASDAASMAAHLLSIYRLRPYVYRLPLRTRALSLGPGSDLCFEWDRLGMDAGMDFRAIGSVREGLNVDAIAWRVE